MRLLAMVASVLILVVVAPAGSLAARDERTGTAVIRVLKLSPLLVRGAGFRPGEKVTVSFTSTSEHLVRRTKASSTGAFTVSFGRVVLERCEAYAISAKGGSGSRAAVKPPRPLCPPA